MVRNAARGLCHRQREKKLKKQSQPPFLVLEFCRTDRSNYCCRLTHDHTSNLILRPDIALDTNRIALSGGYSIFGRLAENGQVSTVAPLLAAACGTVHSRPHRRRLQSGVALRSLLSLALLLLLSSSCDLGVLVSLLSGASSFALRLFSCPDLTFATTSPSIRSFWWFVVIVVVRIFFVPVDRRFLSTNPHCRFRCRNTPLARDSIQLDCYAVYRCPVLII